MFKQTIMLADKSGLREKGSTAPVKLIAKDVRAQSEIREEQKKAAMDNISKMLRQGLINQTEAAEMIRSELEKSKKV